MLPLIEPPPSVEVVVVTASIKPTEKDKLNQSIQLLDREEALIKSLSGGIGEALSGEEGVRSTFYGPSASRPIIRGLGEDRIRLLTNFIQGVDASNISPDHAVAMDGMEAQSIEILKGASALRFGTNAVGGIVNVTDGRLISKLPKNGLSGDFFIGGSGVNNGHAFSAKLKYRIGDFQLGIDTISKKASDFRIAGYAQTEALRSETLDDTFGKVPNSYGNVKINGASINYVKPEYYFGIAKRKENTEYGIPGESAHIELSQSRNDFAGGIKTSGIFEKITFNGSIGDYSHGEIEDTGDVGTLFNSDGYEFRIEARHKSFKGLDGIIGIQTGSRDFEAIGDEAFLLPVTIQNRGIFFSESFERDYWGIEFGARNEKTEYNGLAGNKDFSSTSASFGGFFAPIKGMRIGLILSRTERIPTEVELFANGPHAATQSFEKGNENLKTEIADAMEFSLKAKQTNWNFEFNLWSAKFDNFIIFENTGEFTDNPSDALPIYQAIQANAKMDGFEGNLRKSIGTIADLAANLEFGFDYVRGKFENGSNIPRIPPHAVHLGLNLQGSQTEMGLEYVLYGKQDKLGAFETITEGKGIINANFEYNLPEVPGATLSLSIDNLTNEEVREHTSVLKDSLPRPGRNIKLGIFYKF